MADSTDSTVAKCPSCGTRNRVPAITSGVPQCASCHRALPWLVDARGEDFTAVSQSSLLVLADLWAPWCGPCRTIAPLVEDVARNLAGSLKVVKVNVDDAPVVSQRFGVQGIPTMLLMRSGREVGRQVGALPGHALRAWLDAEIAHSA